MPNKHKFQPRKWIVVEEITSKDANRADSTDKSLLFGGI
jgi:hypothetical protein